MHLTDEFSPVNPKSRDFPRGRIATGEVNELTINRARHFGNLLATNLPTRAYTEQQSRSAP
jgi:hypothetical protein